MQLVDCTCSIMWSQSLGTGMTTEQQSWFICSNFSPYKSSECCIWSKCVVIFSWYNCTKHKIYSYAINDSPNCLCYCNVHCCVQLCINYQNLRRPPYSPKNYVNSKHLYCITFRSSVGKAKKVYHLYQLCGSYHFYQCIVIIYLIRMNMYAFVFQCSISICLHFMR